MIVDLLSSVVPCPLHCPLPSLVIRHLLHHLPSLHHSHQWLVVVFLLVVPHPFVALHPYCCWPRPPPGHVSKVWVARRNSLDGQPFLVPLATGQGLVHDITIDGRGIANIPLLPLGDCHNMMTCTVGRLCPHQHCAKVDRLGGFLLVGHLALLCGRGSTQCWHCS